MPEQNAHIQLGCPQWGHPAWQNRFFPAQTPQKRYLAEYAKFYTSVEGNTTFYALPTEQTVLQWSNQVPSNFKFCFKLPQLITHQQGLAASQKQIDSFFDLLNPMFAKQQIGAIQVQLPPYFSAQHLIELEEFLQAYSSVIPLSVEVRHPDFFNKKASEKALNQLLIAHQVDRVMMDTRPVHSQYPSTPAIIDAQKKKPKVPVHVLSTGNRPIVRYIGQTDLAANREFIKPWLPHFQTWLNQGKNPYLFIHTADNADVHLLTQLWLNMLTEQLGYRPFNNTLWPVDIAEQNKPQSSLF